MRTKTTEDGEISMVLWGKPPSVSDAFTRKRQEIKLKPKLDFSASHEKQCCHGSCVLVASGLAHGNIQGSILYHLYL